MEDQFFKIMAAKSDQELIAIVTVDKNKYQSAAIEAANQEIQIRNIDAGAFVTITEKLTEFKVQSDDLDAIRATTGTRFAHGLIDSVLFSFFFIFFISIVASFRLSGTGNGIASWTILLIWVFLYYGFMEFHFQKTFAKMMTGTKVLMADGTKPTLNDILLRTVCRLIPFDNFSFFFAKSGFHDKFSNTIVVKDVRKSIQTKS